MLQDGHFGLTVLILGPRFCAGRPSAGLCIHRVPTTICPNWHVANKPYSQFSSVQLITFLKNPYAENNYKPYSQFSSVVQLTINMHTLCGAPRSAQELQTLQSVQFSCSTYRKYASFCGAPRSAQELQNLAFTNPTVSSVVQFTANMHTFCGAARSRSRVKYTVFSSQGRRHHANTHRFSSQGRRHHVNTHRFCSQRRRHHVNAHRFCFQRRLRQNLDPSCSGLCCQIGSQIASGDSF